MVNAHCWNWALERSPKRFLTQVACFCLHIFHIHYIDKYFHIHIHIHITNTYMEREDQSDSVQDPALSTRSRSGSRSRGRSRRYRDSRRRNTAGDAETAATKFKTFFRLHQDSECALLPPTMLTLTNTKCKKKRITHISNYFRSWHSLYSQRMSVLYTTKKIIW